MIVGVTGCPGSGKSLLVATITGRGWAHVDADLIGREVVEHDEAVIGELADAFGSDILSDGNVLDRRLLAQRAFSSPENTRSLNGIVHPRLIKRLRDSIDSLKADGENTVVDCALIFEWEIADIFDIVICVTAPRKERVRRLIERDSRSESEILDMFASQLPEHEKASRSDIIVANGGSMDKMSMIGRMIACLEK